MNSPEENAELFLYADSFRANELPEITFNHSGIERRSNTHYTYLKALCEAIKHTNPPFSSRPHDRTHFGAVGLPIGTEAAVDEARFVYDKCYPLLVVHSIGHGRVYYTKNLVIPNPNPALIDKIISHLVDSELGFEQAGYDISKLYDHWRSHFIEPWGNMEKQFSLLDKQLPHLRNR
jgi:hypothetical protein